MADIIRELEKEQLRTDLPKLEVGDTVRVFVKVIEGSRERLQNFEGVVIKIQGGVMDTERAARIVLDEFRAGRIAKITLESPDKEY